MHTIHGKKLLMLKPTQIKISDTHIRGNNNISELRCLAESIRRNGIIEPIAVRKTESGLYVLISGERRLRAAVIAGLRRLPCVLHKIDAPLSDIYSLTENLQRSPLYYFDEALYIKRILKTQNLSPELLSPIIGIPVTHINSRLSLLNLEPEIRSRIQYARLSEEYAAALLLLPEYQRYEVLDEIITETLSLAETHQLINQKLHPKENTPQYKKPEPTELKPVRKSFIGDLRLFGNSLNKLTDTLKNSGITATVKKVENSKYIEYKVKIKKDIPENTECTQLKLTSV